MTGKMLMVSQAACKTCMTAILFVDNQMEMRGHLVFLEQGEWTNNTVDHNREGNRQYRKVADYRDHLLATDTLPSGVCEFRFLAVLQGRPDMVPFSFCARA